MEHMGVLNTISPKPYSIYLRGTINSKPEALHVQDLGFGVGGLENQGYGPPMVDLDIWFRV